MLYELLYPLKEQIFFFNVFRYITFRAMFASITAFLICIFLGPLCFRWLKKINLIATSKREHAPQLEQFQTGKSQTPTMGGLLIVASVVISNCLWGNFQNKHMVLILIVLVSLSLLGFLDDYLKISKGNSRGLTAFNKMMGQTLTGLFLGVYLYFDPSFDKALYIPFVKSFALPLGIFSVFWIAFVIVAASNALNVTDGLDGLAIGCSLFVVGSFALLSYVTGHVNFSSYLNIPYIQESGELAVFCASMLGAGVGFLWFNCYPAEVFMGDTGSLALGGVIGTISLLIKQEILLVIIGGIFVIEALSVILQILSVKLRGSRIFLMAPYHHHLQLKGWSESKVTIRFWIISFLLALIGIATLKLR